jgi:hypothetical protein
MTTDDNNCLVKISKNYRCEKCNYNTCRKYNFEIHNESIKHKNNGITTKNNESLVKVSKKNECSNCNKIFNDRAGLWRHKKKCLELNVENKKDEKTKNEIQKDEMQDKDELIMMLIKQNSELIKETSEFKNMMMKVIENGTTNNSHNVNNSHNKTFNLQFFLNETCKNAMNIMEFIDSVKLQLTDLEKLGEIGYVDGISNIIVKNLKALDVDKRPVHCTDAKREVLYIKDDNKWEKENEDKNKMRKVIKKIANRNSRLLTEFKANHPDCGKSDSLFSDQYNKLIIEAMGGSGDNDLEKEDKIIKKITKEITIDKEMY